MREQENEERILKKELLQSSGSHIEEQKMQVQRPAERTKEEKERSEGNQDYLPVTWAASYLPVKQVKNGIILTTDNRYVKLIEVLPINFLLRSSDQRNIIFSYMSYLKIAPQKFQIKVVSKKAEIEDYIQKIREEASQEKDERCRMLQEDYIELLRTLGTKDPK